MISNYRYAFSCFLWVLTVLCSGRHNSVNIYPILIYFISFERKFPALQDSSFSKSRAEHPFSWSGPLSVMCMIVTESIKILKVHGWSIKQCTIISVYCQYYYILGHQGQMGAYLGKGTYWQLITSCWLYFGVMFQI